MNEGYHTLADLWQAAWDMLAEGAADPASPARRAALATSGLEGRPSLRTVLLRGAHPGPGTLEIFTDCASGKIGEIEASPAASLLTWHPERMLQLRVALDITVLTGPRLDAIWQDMPRSARQNYGGTPKPGTPLARPEDYAPGIDRDRLALLSGRVAAIEVLHLGARRHLRAEFRRGDGFAGQWIAP